MLQPSSKPIPTANAIVQAIVALAEEYPDAYYEPAPGEDRGNCSYVAGTVHNGPPCPGCIVGHAVTRLLPDAFTDEPMDDTPVATVVLKFCEQCTVQELDWLGLLQSEQDRNTVWADAVKAADRKYGRPGLAATCCRCGTALHANFCNDETCPFSQHRQDCNKGWYGHPEHPGEPVCTCETSAVLGRFIVTQCVSKEDPLGGAVGYGNAYISLYPVVLQGVSPGRMTVGGRCRVRYGMQPNLPAEYWIERIE